MCFKSGESGHIFASKQFRKRKQLEDPDPVSFTRLLTEGFSYFYFINVFELETEIL